jgi:NAD(P)-dependent dehydrogenase (short-subunit alcohol dehydrogenase family)
MAASSAPQIGQPAREPYRGPANLDGKIAVVTGGTQGLGEAIARLFAERGAAGLVICGRNSDNGARVANEISAAGCPTVFVKADLSKVADCRNVVAEADRRFGRVDALVNAAALTDRGDIFDTTEERYNEIFDVNVRAPFFLIQAAVRIMRREKIAGAIVNIQSMSGHGGHRLDVDARRGPDHEDLPWRAGRMARGRREDQAVRAAHRSKGGGARLRLSLLG